MRTLARAVPAMVGVLVLALVALVAAVSRPSTPHQVPAVLAATTGTTVRATLFCPDVRQLRGTLKTNVIAGSTTPGSGDVTVAPIASSTPVGTILRAGQAVATYGGTVSGPLTLQATGPVSAGVVAEQIARANKTTARGWAEARCEPARSDQWFVGAATEPGDSPTVVLANPGDTRAIVTVTVLTPAGLVAAPAGGNLVLAPRTVQSVPLVSLAPGATATAVDVQTETGLVSAAIRDVRTHGETLLGTDYVPVGEPGSTLTVAGLPGVVTGRAPARTLYVGVPGSAAATVQVTVTTPTGSYVPVGLDALPVAAGAVRPIVLSKILGTQPATVTVRSVSSDGASAPPVVAGVLIDAASTGPSHIHEIAYLGSVTPLAGPALIPIVRDLGAVAGAADAPTSLASNVDSVIILSAPQGGATVTVTARPPGGGTVRTFTRTIAAGTTTGLSMLALKVTDGSSVVLTPQPDSGPVYATRLIEEAGALGPLLSAFELSGAPPQQPVPAVAPLPLQQP
jgi:hypothetical protein